MRNGGTVGSLGFALLALAMPAAGAVAEADDGVMGAVEIEAALTRGAVAEPMVEPSTGLTSPETSSYVSLDSVQFERDSAALTPRAKRQLDEVAEALGKVAARGAVAQSMLESGPAESSSPPASAPAAHASAGARVVIDGHTCNLGTADHNYALGAARAQAVRRYLIGKGVDGSKLTAHSSGEAKPVTPNTSESARVRNRRVDFILQRPKDIVRSRGVADFREAGDPRLDVTFQAIAKSRGGRCLEGDAIGTLTQGDQFRAVYKVLAAGHVFVVMRTSQGEILWLVPGGDMPAEDRAKGLWHYPGEERALPASPETDKDGYYVLDSAVGTEILVVAASPEPLASADAFEQALRHAGPEPSAQTLTTAMSHTHAEVHILVIDHE